MLSAAKNLSNRAERSFASLRMTAISPAAVDTAAVDTALPPYRSTNPIILPHDFSQRSLRRSAVLQSDRRERPAILARAPAAAHAPGTVAGRGAGRAASAPETGAGRDHRDVYRP